VRAEFTKNTGEATLEGGEGGSGDELKKEKRSSFERTMTRKRSLLFEEKIG